MLIVYPGLLLFAFNSANRWIKASFTNAGTAPARLLCLCAPSGQEEFFTLVGQPVATRTEPPASLDEQAQDAFRAKAQALAPRYATELLPPAAPS